ncbi:MAG: hypothetical protein ACK5ST_01345, partial [bacterium]
AGIPKITNSHHRRQLADASEMRVSHAPMPRSVMVVASSRAKKYLPRCCSSELNSRRHVHNAKIQKPNPSANDAR